MIRRSRRLVTVLLVAALLAAQPVKPAHAFVQAVLIAAVTYIGTSLLGLFTGDGKLKGMLLALETELPIMLSTVEMKINENIAKASAAAHQEMLKREAMRQSARAHPADILQANCQAMTGLADAAATEIRATRVYEPLLFGEHQRLENRGTAVASGTGAYQHQRSLSTDRLIQVEQERLNHVCRYATKNDLKAAIAAKCKKADGTPVTTAADIEANPYKGADTIATTLLGTQAFDEDKHYLAAIDYCTALTGNQPLNTAQGRALGEDIGNLKQFLVALSDKSARNISYFSCQRMLARKLPIDSKFAKNDATMSKLVEPVTPDAANSRKPEDISKSAKSYLTAGEGYAEVDPGAKTTGEVARGGQKQLIKGQLVSGQQNDEAIYVARFMAPDFKNKVTGTQGLLWSRVANLQIVWRQYQELERQVLTDAVELARMVRTAPGYGDPPASAASR